MEIKLFQFIIVLKHQVLELEIGILKLKDLKLLAQVHIDYRVILGSLTHHLEIKIQEKVKINSLVIKKIIIHNQVKEFQKRENQTY